MHNGETANEVEETPVKLPTGPKKDPKDFFKLDRGERAAYFAAGPTDSVLLPLTRDGYEALLERATGQFSPPLPMDDSVRKVFSGYVHHMVNELNTITIEQIGKVLWKSISNALTWEIDQEIKTKQVEELTQLRAAAQKAADDKRREEKIAAKEIKQASKASRRMTVATKPNEAEGA